MALTKIDDRGLKTPIDLLDNEKIRFGTGNDLELFHDQSNSYISETGTGKLILQSDGPGIHIRGVAGEESIVAASNGAVELYFNGSPKLQTISAGVSISGELQVEDVEGTTLRLGNTAAAASDGDYLSGIDFHIKDNNDSTGAVCAAIRTYADQNHTASAKGTALAFHTTDDDTTTLDERIRITHDGKVGIGTTSPANLLSLESSAPVLSIRDTASYSAYTNGGKIYFQGLDSDSAVKTFAGIKGVSQSSNNGQLRLQTRSSGTLYDRLTIHENGSVGVNTTGAQSYDPAARSLVVGEVDGYGHTGMTIASNGTDKQGAIYFADGTGSASYRGRIEYLHTDDSLSLGTAGGGGKVKVTSGGDLSIADGNLVVANGHGIDFSAQTGTSATGAATGSAPSEVLDHYEEGTWTATVVTGTCSDNECHYTKIGNKCTVWGRVHSFSDTSTNDVLKITGLPFTVGTSNTGGNSFQKHISTEANCTYVSTNNWITFYGHNTADQWSYVTHLSCSSGAYIYFHATYKTT